MQRTSRTSRVELPIMPGTRLLRIEVLDKMFKVWLYTNDFVYGTYLELHADGSINQVTVDRDDYQSLPIHRST